MSIAKYGDITIPYAFTTQFRQDPMYDDVSGTDWCGTKFDIQVGGVLNINYLSAIDPTLIGTANNAADIMRTIRYKLLKPRQILSFTFDGSELIPQSTTEGKVDTGNGPRPQTCQITRLNNESFLITFHIIAEYWERNDPASVLAVNTAGQSVLYNRWTETVEIDNLQYSRRTREGKFKIRSDNAEGVIPDQIRNQMAMIGVPRGFLRESSRYTQTPDGLGIQYTIVDKEQFKMPPNPAFKASGTYTESTSKGDAKRFANLHVRLEGARNVSQDVLARLAVSVAALKCAIVGAPLIGPVSRRSILHSASVRIDLYENVVECDLNVMFKSNAHRTNGIALFGGDFRSATSFTPLTDGIDPSTNAPPYLERGTAGILLQAAAYYDPSLRGVIVNPSVGQFTQGIMPGQAGVNVEA